MGEVARTEEKEQPRHVILRSINLNRQDSGRSTVEQIYLSKQRSE